LIGNILVSASAPFQISKNNTEWTTSLSYSPTSTGYLFVRYNPSQVGAHYDSIVFVNGDLRKTIYLEGHSANRTYTILSMCNNGGTIEPKGNVEVVQYTNQSFQIIPEPNYYIAELFVNDEHITPVPNNYTFNNVVNNHHIYAFFMEMTDINSATIENYLIVYPNPASHHVYIKFANDVATVTNAVVHDILGKKIEKIEFNTETLKIDISSLNSGVYFVTIYSDQGVFVRKILKQ